MNQVKKLKNSMASLYTLASEDNRIAFARPSVMLNPEHVLIPFQASPLPAGPWIVFAPHADDETFGMGGSLLKARREGVETHLVVLTDGALGGERDDLVDIRRQEVTRAAERLGIKTLHCWSEPDRSLGQDARLIEKIANMLIELAPGSVFFPAPLEIHPDHRATAFLVWSALQKSRNEGVHPTPIAYEIGVQNPINYLIDISAQSEEKKQVMDIYASQNSENNYQELVLALDKGRTFSLPEEVTFAEGFFYFKTEDLDHSLQEMTHRIVDLYQ